MSVILHLKKGHDHRFNAGHPWIYSNELAESPKNIPAGGVVELRDYKDNFLAFGFGNPHSLIAVRLLTRDKKEHEPLSTEAILKKIVAAHAWRARAGLTQFSYRLIFGEGDNLPGLIIDRFLTEKQQVFVIEPHTLGMDLAIENVIAALVEFSKTDNTAILVKYDAHMRALEGLKTDETRVVKDAGLNLENVKIQVAAAASPREALTFECNLLRGQKTGFFLDQAHNTKLVCDEMRKIFKNERESTRPLRVLDLFSYVGQWAAQVSQQLGKMGVDHEVALVDSSQAALEFAARNVTTAGCKSIDAVKMDIMKDLEKLPENHYDIVICDPPALVKKRKDLPQGERAYLKLNSLALSRLSPQGLFVSASCSGLFEESLFTQTLSKAARRAGKKIHWLSRGHQAPDHPMNLEFGEGTYLKCWVGIVDK